MSAYGVYPTKRPRRTKAEIREIKDAIVEVVAADHPMTVRGVFYRLVSSGVVDKTEAEYKSTVARLLLELRRGGEVPYSWIADGTRWMRKPRTWDSVGSLLQHTATTYRRALWDAQPAYVEVWVEKDALAGGPRVLIRDVPVELRTGRQLALLSEANQEIAFLGLDSNAERIRAFARGRGELYRLGYDGARWHCSCPARSTCAHLHALKAVCVVRPATADEAAS